MTGHWENKLAQVQLIQVLQNGGELIGPALSTRIYDVRAGEIYQVHMVANICSKKTCLICHWSLFKNKVSKRV